MLRVCRFAGFVVECGALAVAFGADQQSDPKITLTVQASYAKLAIRQLGEAAHVQLLTSPQTANDIVSFRLQDVPLSEAVKQIADAVDGKWKQEGATFRLIRTADQQNAEVKDELNQAVERIRKLIQKREDELQKMRPWSSDEADALATKAASLIKKFDPSRKNFGTWYYQGDRLSDETPIGRAFTRIAATFDPAELAELPKDIKTVWSSNPTPTEKPLQADALPIIEDFLKEQGDWANAIDKIDLTAPTTNGLTHYVGALGDFKEDAGGKVFKVLLTVTPQGTNFGFYVELMAFNQKGKKVAWTNTVLTSADDRAKTPPANAAPGDDEKIKLDADVQAFFEKRNDPQGLANSKKLKDSLINKLLHPEKPDPLSILMSSKLIQAANIKRMNMVAHLTDNMFYADGNTSTTGVSVDEFLRKIDSVTTISAPDGGWLVVKPKRPNECRTYQADRTELGKYLRRLSSGRPLSLDEQAAFALSLPDPLCNFLPWQLCNLLKLPRVDDYDPAMLRFYGLLTADQKERMMHDGLTFGSLRVEQLECVKRMLYRTRSRLGYTPPKGEEKRFDFDLFYNGLWHEPTECLPNGIPPQGLIKLTVENSNVVMATSFNPDSNGTPGPAFSAQDLAFQKYSQEHPEQFPGANDASHRFNLGHFQFGPQVKMTFLFQFTPTLSLDNTLEDTNLKDFQTMTMDDLPSDFKKQFQDAYNHYVMAYANTKPGQVNGGGSVPPP